jgi:hypothetical protein
MAAIAAAAIAAGGSAYSIIQGAKAKSEANQAAASAAQSIAQMQEADKFRNLQVPTLGLEMAQQNVQARQAQQLEGLRDIGAAGVLGGLTALNTQGQAQDLALAAQAQEAQYARDFAQAQNAQAIEQRRMGREAGLEQQRLTGAQAASAYGQQQINAGITGLAQTAGNVLVQSLKDKPLFEDATKPPVKTTAAAAQKPTITTLTGEQIQQNAQSAFAPQMDSMLPTGMQTLSPQVTSVPEFAAPAVIAPVVGTEAAVNANPAIQEDAEYKKMVKQAMIDLSKDPVNIENWKRRGLRWNPVTQETELMFDELGIDPVTLERKKK